MVECDDGAAGLCSGTTARSRRNDEGTGCNGFCRCGTYLVWNKFRTSDPAMAEVNTCKEVIWT